MEFIKQVLFCIAVSLAIGCFSLFCFWLNDEVVKPALAYLSDILPAILLTFVVMIICEWLFGLNLVFW
jgi:hypothetical protein